MDLFRQCVSQIFPGRALAVSIRKYPHAQPRCVVRGEQIFLAGPPPCDICPANRCHCWIGPALIRVARSYTNGREPDLEKIFKIYDEGQGLYDARRMRFSIMHNMDVTEAEPDQQCHSEGDTELDSNASSAGPEIKMEDNGDAIQGNHSHRMDVDHLTPQAQVGDGSSSFLILVVPLTTPSSKTNVLQADLHGRAAEAQIRDVSRIRHSSLWHDLGPTTRAMVCALIQSE